MRRYGKAFTLSVLLMFMVALVGTSKPADAATPYNNIAQTKLLYEKNDIRKDADGRYYNTYIAHDGMKLAADGNRHVCEMSAEGYKRTRIERGELYSGTRDGVVYYFRMNTTEAGYTLDSQVSTVYELVELNINTGAEQVVYSKKTDSTVRTKAVGYLTRRQGDVIYILEKLKQEPASDDSSYKLYFDIDTYDLTTGKSDTYGSYTLDIDKKTASQNIITMICGFFIPGEGKVGLFWHEVKSEIKSDTVSYGAIGEDFSSIRLYDKSSSLITSYELAGSTFFNGVRISDYDVSTGNLFFTASGMYSGFCLMVANITGNTIRMAPSITDKTGLKRERSIAGGYAGSGFGEMGLIGGRYLAVLNSEWRFSDGESDATVHILDASKISYDKVDLVNEQSQELSSDGPEPDIYRINHPRKAQSIRLSNRLDATLFAMKVRYGELDMTRKMDLASDVFVSRESHDVHDVSGVGVRAAYNKVRDSIIFNTGEKELTEVSVKDKKVIAKYQTAHPVWCTLISGNTLVVMEREGSKGNTWVGSIDRNARNVDQKVAERFYFESIDMTLSQTTGIEVPATTISVGASLDLKATYPTAAKSAVNFSSSDESVFSVTSDGKGAAWRAGSATVTATREDGGTAGVVTIKVSPKSSVAASATEIDTDLNYYSVYALKNDIYGHICTEWIEELSDGTIMRVGCKLVKRSREDDDGSVISSMIPESVCASFYSADGKPLDEKVIPLELTKFGGFYHGKDAYYLVFGGDNYDETTGVKEKEVVRIVKYDSSWKRLGACSFYGKETNTISTFIAGTVRMDETADGVLYIHTAKQIYKDKKGLNHQMNMLLAVDEKTMSGISTPEVSASEGRVAVDGYYAPETLWCSHSFDQYVKTEGDMVYTLALGDGSPRGCMYGQIDRKGMGYKPGSSVTMKNTSETSLLLSSVLYPEGYSGKNGENNPTGMNIGGFELTADGVMGVGNYYRNQKPIVFPEEERRNIFITMRDRTLPQKFYRYLTDYDSKSSEIFTWRPKLVKLDDHHYLMMWMEYKNDPKKPLYEQDFYTCLQYVDADANPVGPRVKKHIYLSDCDPIVRKDGSVSWFADGLDKVLYYTIDPYDLSSIKESEKMVIGDEDMAPSESGITDNSDTHSDAKKPKCNLKSGKIYKLGKEVVISSNFALKSVMLNGKKIFKKKPNVGSFDIVIKLEKYKKKLKMIKKKKGKYKKAKKYINRIVIKNVKGASRMVKFYVK